MILVSADRASGRTSLVSIPRNLRRLQFPPGSPLDERFPDGFDNIANAVYPYVLTKPDLQEQYAKDGLQPEAVAISEAIGYSLGVRIDDYVLVNMQGFLELIDSVGGVTVDLDRAVPLPPALPGAKHDIPSSVGPGTVEMDGTLALAFARSRYADSDYGRMGRQRQLLAALGEQISLSDAIGGFSERRRCAVGRGSHVPVAGRVHGSARHARRHRGDHRVGRTRATADQPRSPRLRPDPPDRRRRPRGDHDRRALPVRPGVIVEPHRSPRGERSRHRRTHRDPEPRSERSRRLPSACRRADGRQNGSQRDSVSADLIVAFQKRSN